MSENKSEGLTRLQLDAAKCQVPGCKCQGKHHELDLLSHCHPHGPVDVCYHRAGLLAGLVELRCFVCGKLVCRIRVESGILPEMGQN